FMFFRCPQHIFLALTPRPPTPTLFPYTTLFRSPRSYFRSRIGDQQRRCRSASGNDLGNLHTLAAERLDQAVHGRKSGFGGLDQRDRKSTRLNSSHVKISYAVFCLKKKRTLANKH